MKRIYMDNGATTRVTEPVFEAMKPYFCEIYGNPSSAHNFGYVSRHAVDAALAGEPLDPAWRAELDKVSHRPYSEGFYYNHPEQYTGDARYLRDWQVSAIVTSCAPDGRALLSLRNKFRRGETLELVGPGVRPISFSADDLADESGSPLEEARIPQMPLRLTLPCQVPPLSILRREARQA